MESVKPVENKAPSAFEQHKENNSAIANGVLPTEASFLKESIDVDARLLKGDGKADNPESSAELMDELQYRVARQHAVQEENLSLHEALRALEVRCREAEQNASRKGSQVEELQKRLMGMEEEASAARSAATESLRLTDENTLLGNQLKQMEFNLKDLISTQGLGHTNAKQPIQYHLRLKNELEELRSECVGLLKERFHLEQCIRFLAATAIAPCYSPLPNGEAFLRNSVQRINYQPRSLQQNSLYVTPSSKATMLKSGRGVAAAKIRTTTPTKEELIDAIQQAAAKTASSFQELAADVEQQADSASTPLRRRQSTRNNGFEEEESPISDDRTPSEDAERYPSLNPMEGMTGQTSIEKRIIAKIADICSPGKTGTSSKLLQQAQDDVIRSKDAAKSNSASKSRRSSTSSAPAKANGKVIWR